ncbi:ATP-binding cassette domain-containing protein [Tumebacillus sp. BK434]|uniref:ATP-binding cassette domain-containing protein n=1 Tax=Tumebacillus sp. BK434 TaxID=2512169 RepID=UPI0014054DB0|nr:ATP-binding cassette domain-containing protein [Tumebacillus sp. BK434]
MDRVALGSILQDVSFELEEGTITLLIGQTGAGKSSLLDVLTGLNRFDHGSVLYDGRPLWDGKQVQAEVLQEIGVVFQFPEHQLFARTVQGEFDYSLKPLRLAKPEAQARTLTALREVGLPEEMTTQSPLVLSGGQKRRVALATTFATMPKWLFLDEPTAGLDPLAVQHLVEFLQSCKGQTTGGIVIATHDLDAFFPIADRVLLLDHGRLAASTTPQALCEDPHLLRQARVGVPSSTALAHAFAAQGIRLTPHPLPPEQMADEILESWNVLPSAMSHAESSPSATAQTVHQSAVAVQAEFRHSAPAQQESKQQPPTGVFSLSAVIRQLDPRAKWAFYLLVSLGVLVQASWAGLTIATAVTALCMWTAGMWKRDVWRMMKPFLFFILFSVVLSGLRFGDGIGYEWAAAERTLGQLYKFLLLMLLGMWLSATTSQLMMKQGLETALAPLKKLKLPVEAFALATSLMLRFVPVILQELRRFSRITKARGKSVKGNFRLRDTSAIVVPLLLSVLRLGEDLSVAMEARGYAKFGNRRTSAVKLRIVRHDRVILLAGGVLFAVLLCARYL